MKVVVLEVSGLGPVPAMKNNKMIARGRLITNPKRQEWMSRCISLFVSQFISASRTTGDATWTGQRQRSSIALSLPADDCWTWIQELRIRASKCQKGEEGATIRVEPIE